MISEEEKKDRDAVRKLAMEVWEKSQVVLDSSLGIAEKNDALKKIISARPLGDILDAAIGLTSLSKSFSLLANAVLSTATAESMTRPEEADKLMEKCLQDVFSSMFPLRSTI